MLAARQGHSDVVQALIADARADLNLLNKVS